jgi:hypothetical protein
MSETSARYNIASDVALCELVEFLIAALSERSMTIIFMYNT